MSVGLSFVTEEPRRPWTEQVLLYRIAELPAITPLRWTSSDTSWKVRLVPGAGSVANAGDNDPADAVYGIARSR